jgi:hypothetical protein
MALGSRRLAKTTARVGATRLGTARLGFRPRNTTDHVPGTAVAAADKKARYYVWAQLFGPAGADPNTVVLS